MKQINLDRDVIISSGILKGTRGVTINYSNGYNDTLRIRIPDGTIIEINSDRVEYTTEPYIVIVRDIETNEISKKHTIDIKQVEKDNFKLYSDNFLNKANEECIQKEHYRKQISCPNTDNAFNKRKYPLKYSVTLIKLSDMQCEVKLNGIELTMEQFKSLQIKIDGNNY